MQGEVLVKYKGQAPATLNQIGVVKKTFPNLNLRKIVLKQGLSVPEAIRILETDPSVEYAEPNYILHALVTPNDPFFSKQWYMNRINAPNAWDITTGSEGVLIAVLDTGIDYSHPDLAPNIWTNPGEIPGNGVDDDQNGRIDDVRGWDLINNSNDPMDDNGHGTAVSGLIGAVGNNAKGIAGLNFTSRLIPLKVMDFTGTGNVGAVIEAIQYAQQKGAQVVNCSFGFSGKPSRALQDAITGASGILFSCAAGNEKTNNDMKPLFPASYDNPNIISVAASSDMDQLSTFSDYGPTTVDLVAPGQNIFTTQIIRDGIFFDNFSKLNWSANPAGSWVLSSSPGTFLSPPSSLAENPVQGFQPNTVTSPVISLTGRHACILSYELALNIPQDASFFAEASPDGANWPSPPLNQFSGNVNTFNDNTLVGASLDGFSGQNIFIRFRLQAPSGSVFIDDLNINCASVAYNGKDEYDDGLNGTSFSAPLVTGTAGLLRAVYPSLSATDIKTLILGGVDIVPGLNGVVASSGRLDVGRSFLPPAPANFTASGSSGAVTLTWTDDPNEDSYTLEKTTAGGVFNILTTLPANSASYSDTAIQNGTSYIYRIKAGNSFGESAYVESAPVTPGTGGGGGGGGGGCFIATAAFGSPLADEVITLKKFRDGFLMKNAPGRFFVKSYYRFSPALADLIKGSEGLRAATRVCLYPVVYSLKYPAWAVLLFSLCAGALGIGARKIVKYTAVSKSAEKKGFTLLEILIVVAILSILAAIVAPRIMGRTDDARVADAKVQIRNLETALKLFKLDNGFYPLTEQGLQALVEKPSAGKIPSRYREGGYLEQHKVPADPWGNPFIYLSPGTNGDYDLSSLGADGKEGGEGYDKDIKSWELE